MSLKNNCQSPPSFGGKGAAATPSAASNGQSVSMSSSENDIVNRRQQKRLQELFSPLRNRSATKPSPHLASHQKRERERDSSIASAVGVIVNSECSLLNNDGSSVNVENLQKVQSLQRKLVLRKNEDERLSATNGDHMGNGISNSSNPGMESYGRQSNERDDPQQQISQYQHHCASKSYFGLVNTSKIFNDHVHQNIKLEGICLRIVDTPEFQRLHMMKQLGTSDYVFRGATHTRFEHSIGVAHLSERFAKTLQRNQPSLGITDTDVMCVMVAGLCHDLGHGPYSHVFDGVFLKRMYPNGIDASGRKWRHEDGSIMMLRHLLAKNEIVFADYGLTNYCEAAASNGNKGGDDNNTRIDDDQLFIEEMIGGIPEHRRAGRGPNKFFLYDIVNNIRSGLDVDKLDYFQRDMKMSNVYPMPVVTFDRFIELAIVLPATHIGNMTVGVGAPPSISSAAGSGSNGIMVKKSGGIARSNSESSVNNGGGNANGNGQLTMKRGHHQAQQKRQLVSRSKKTKGKPNGKKSTSDSNDEGELACHSSGDNSSSDDDDEGEVTCDSGASVDESYGCSQHNRPATFYNAGTSNPATTGATASVVNGKGTNHHNSNSRNGNGTFPAPATAAFAAPNNAQNTFPRPGRSLGFGMSEMEREIESLPLMICYPEKMVGEALNLFAARFHMHQEVYQHKAVKQVEFMIVDALELANPYIDIRGSVTQLHPMGLYKMSETIFDMEAMANMKDSILDIISNDRNPALKPAQDLIQRILCRDLYSCVGEAAYWNYNNARYNGDENGAPAGAYSANKERDLHICSSTEEEIGREIVSLANELLRVERNTAMNRSSGYNSDSTAVADVDNDDSHHHISYNGASVRQNYYAGGGGGSSSGGHVVVGGDPTARLAGIIKGQWRKGVSNDGANNGSAMAGNNGDNGCKSDAYHARPPATSLLLMDDDADNSGSEADASSAASMGTEVNDSLATPSTAGTGTASRHQNQNHAAEMQQQQRAVEIAVTNTDHVIPLTKKRKVGHGGVNDQDGYITDISVNSEGNQSYMNQHPITSVQGVNGMTMSAGVHDHDMASAMLTERDIIVEKMHVHYGLKHSNPVSRLRFFPKTIRAGMPVVGREIPEESYVELLPRTFERCALRVFCRHPSNTSKEGLARRGFEAFCMQYKMVAPFPSCSQPDF